jgi:hypothetical protein
MRRPCIAGPFVLSLATCRTRRRARGNFLGNVRSRLQPTGPRPAHRYSLLYKAEANGLAAAALDCVAQDRLVPDPACVQKTLETIPELAKLGTSQCHASARRSGSGAGTKQSCTRQRVDCARTVRECVSHYRNFDCSGEAVLHVVPVSPGRVQESAPQSSMPPNDRWSSSFSAAADSASA